MPLVDSNSSSYKASSDLGADDVLESHGFPAVFCVTRWHGLRDFPLSCTFS